MAHFIVKEPEGTLAIWSTIVDNFILVRCTKEELIAWMVSEEKKRIETLVESVVNNTQLHILRYEECLKILGEFRNTN